MTTYCIWAEDQDQDDASRRDAASPENAARDQAEHDDSRGNWEGDCTTYLVEDVATGKRWTVEVEREMAPWFRAGRAAEVQP